MPHTLNSQGLVTASASSGPEVHLFAFGATRSLCGRPLGDQSVSTSFRTHGCLVCRDHALDQGVIAVRDRGRAYINLRRVPPQA
jgi:hypothetical protein